MSLEEMIKLLDITRREWSSYVDGFDPKEHEAFNQIIAALRAGQKMRNGTDIDQDMSGPYIDNISGRMLASGCADWDKALVGPSANSSGGGE